MIVSASYRADIPAFYARWFRRRLAAGQCADRDRAVANFRAHAPDAARLFG